MFKKTNNKEKSTTEKLLSDFDVNWYLRKLDSALEEEGYSLVCVKVKKSKVKEKLQIVEDCD